MFHRNMLYRNIWSICTPRVNEKVSEYICFRSEGSDDGGAQSRKLVNPGENTRIYMPPILLRSELEYVRSLAQEAPL